MHSVFYTVRRILLCSACTAIMAFGGFDGDYRLFDYNALFESGLIPDIGQDKISSVESGDVLVSGNLFSGNSTEAMLERSVSNIFVMATETQCVNHCAAVLLTDSDSFGGTVAPTNNLVLNIYPGDEEELLMPFYFSRNTNMAVNISPPSAEFPFELGFGMIVRKGNGMDNSDLEGTYVRYSLGNAVHGTTGNGWGNTDRFFLENSIIEFDGSGAYSSASTNYATDRAIAETNLVFGGDSMSQSIGTLSALYESHSATTATYSVLSDGTLLIDGTFGTITNQLTPDGNLAVSTLAQDLGAFAYVTFNVVVKQPDNMPTNAIDAVFFLTEMEEEFGGDGGDFGYSGINLNYLSLGRSYVFLDSAGAFSIRSDYWGMENRMYNHWTDIDPAPGETNLISCTRFNTSSDERTIEFESGTYTIRPDGTVMLNFEDGETGAAQLSANGEYLIYGFADATAGDTATRTLGIGIRRDPPPPPPGLVVFNNDMQMTPTGLVMTATAPTNYPIEGIGTDDLMSGEWYSGGIFSTDDGIIEIHDPSAAESEAGYYSATFVPW